MASFVEHLGDGTIKLKDTTNRSVHSPKGECPSITAEGTKTTSVKACSHCKETKPVSGFNKNKHRKDGLQNNCRSCQKEMASTYYRRNRKNVLKQQHDARNRPAFELVQGVIHSHENSPPDVKLRALLEAFSKEPSVSVRAQIISWPANHVRLIKFLGAEHYGDWIKRTAVIDAQLRAACS